MKWCKNDEVKFHYLQRGKNNGCDGYNYECEEI